MLKSSKILIALDQLIKVGPIKSPDAAAAETPAVVAPKETALPATNPNILTRLDHLMTLYKRAPQSPDGQIAKKKADELCAKYGLDPVILKGKAAKDKWDLNGQRADEGRAQETMAPEELQDLLRYERRMDQDRIKREEKRKKDTEAAERDRLRQWFQEQQAKKMNSL